MTIFGYIWMFLLAVGFILGFQKKQVLTKAGKSIGCFAFLLTNWAVFYNKAYPHDKSSMKEFPYLTDIWRWLPAVTLSGVLIICLLIIWKPFNSKTRIIVVSSLAGIAITVAAAVTWENFGAVNPQYWNTTAHINYDETFYLQETCLIQYFSSIE